MSKGDCVFHCGSRWRLHGETVTIQSVERDGIVVLKDEDGKRKSLAPLVAAMLRGSREFHEIRSAE
jgi:hypothetical protein